jgi:hypothetical protein
LISNLIEEPSIEGGVYELFTRIGESHGQALTVSHPHVRRGPPSSANLWAAFRFCTNRTGMTAQRRTITVPCLAPHDLSIILDDDRKLDRRISRFRLVVIMGRFQDQVAFR